VDVNRNKGLGPQVRGADTDPTESGLLIAEYTTAGLCNQIWGLAMPSHLMSVSTDSGQEDHVSMAVNVAMRACDAAERLAQILAIELAFAAQAELVRAETPAEGKQAVALGRATRGALSKVSEAFPPWVRGGDRELTWDIETLAQRVLSGEIAQATGYGFERH
jgi:histidine ammonia-lyase